MKYNYDVNWVDGDLCDYRSVSSVIETVHPQQIYHLVLSVGVTPSWNMPSIYMQTNAIGTINLFEALLGIWYVRESLYPALQRNLAV